MPEVTEVNVQDVLNQKVAPILRRIESKLNRNTRPYGDLQPGGLYHLTQITNLGGGVTRYSSEDDAFNLNPPAAGNVRDTLITESAKNKLLIRRIYGYAAASRLILLEDEEEIERRLYPFIQEIILTLENEVGFRSTVPHYGTYYGTFKRPGANDMYFRDSEMSAGFELRLMSDTYPMIAFSGQQTNAGGPVILGLEHGITFAQNGNTP